MADGDKTASGVGMGMIIGLLVVLLVVAVGAFVILGGGRQNPASSAGQTIEGAASGAGHTISSTVNVK